MCFRRKDGVCPLSVLLLRNVLKALEKSKKSTRCSEIKRSLRGLYLRKDRSNLPTRVGLLISVFGLAYQSRPTSENRPVGE